LADQHKDAGSGIPVTEILDLRRLGSRRSRLLQAAKPNASALGARVAYRLSNGMYCWYSLGIELR
jgi:hypothetical protein